MLIKWNHVCVALRLINRFSEWVILVFVSQYLRELSDRSKWNWVVVPLKSIRFEADNNNSVPDKRIPNWFKVGGAVLCGKCCATPNLIGIITDCNIISLIGFPPQRKIHWQRNESGSRKAGKERNQPSKRRIIIVDIYFHNQQLVHQVSVPTRTTIRLVLIVPKSPLGESWRPKEIINNKTI